jgi:hypothetical protein
MGLLAAGIAFWLYTTWRYYAVVRRLAARGIPPVFFPQRPWWSFVPLAVCAVLCLSNVYKLVRGLVIARRGGVVLSATPAGLVYRNVPAWRGSGRIARDELSGLVVRLDSIKLPRGKVYRLEARRHGGERAVPLLLGKDIEVLQRAADALGEAMGIRAAAPDSTEAPSARPAE